MTEQVQVITKLCTIKAAGVYTVTNLLDGKRYVGSAHNFRKRNYLHVRSLTRGTGNIKLQRAVNKHGIEHFSFDILLICAPPMCLFYEERAITRLETVEFGYNVRRIPFSNIGTTLPCSEETKRKISAANKGRGKGLPGNMKGRSHSEKSRQKMSASKRKIFRKWELNGERLCLSDWAERIGITTRALGNRLRRGWPVDRALTEQSRGY